MLKIDNHGGQPRERQSSKRKAFVVLIVVLLSIIPASGSLGRWTGLWRATKPTTIAPLVTQGGSSPSNPSKEYIYLNGRLIATEEPVATPPPASPPTAPSGLIATAASTSQINLSWTDNASNETGIK